MALSIGQSGHLSSAIGKELDTLPPEIEKFAADSELKELKRVASALNKRIVNRQMKEDPRTLVAAIMKAKNGS